MRTRLLAVSGVLAALLAAFAASGCHIVLGLDKATITDGGGGTGGEGGTGGAGGTTTIDPGCVPSDTSAAVADACGLFVSASKGDDANDGTAKDKAFATLGKAMAAAKGKPVYACVGEKPFDEAVALDGAVTLFGGLDCETWAYAPGSRTTWTAPAGEVVAMVKLGASLHVEDFAITARDAPALMPEEHAHGRSSIAIVAETTSVLELERCDVTAGNGGDGAAGEPPEGTGTPGAIGANGADGCDNDQGEFGGKGGQMMCGATPVSGGQGGTGNTIMSGGDGSSGVPLDATTGKGGLGQGVATSCDVDGKGGDGMPGTAGSAGTGATLEGLGTLSAAGYVGARGGDGTSGTPGQGAGGGGGAKSCSGGNAGPSGGGGGSGGCAGAGGKGGYGGGASIGIASLGATLTLSDVKITAGKGGKGGNGGGGQPGGPGGTGGMPGAGDGTGVACAGGKGGDGGAGGKGGGGRGGHSIGIAYSGEKPEVSHQAFTLGAPGDGGNAGEMGEGAAGVTAEVQEFN